MPHSNLRRIHIGTPLSKMVQSHPHLIHKSDLSNSENAGQRVLLKRMLMLDYAYSCTMIMANYSWLLEPYPFSAFAQIADYALG